MIVRADNWHTKEHKRLEKDLVDLFNEEAVRIRKALKEGAEEYTVLKAVHSYIHSTLKSYAVSNKYRILPDALYELDHFYIFDVVVLPTGGILFSFIARVYGDYDPVRLDVIY